MENKEKNGSLLKDQIHKYVTINVQDGVFKPGSKLNEEAISQALKVSRTPVREVLTQLASEGYIKKVPRVGFFVREWSAEEKLETYEVIGALDFLCAKKAIDYLSEQDFKVMRESIAKMDLAIEFQNYSDYVKNQFLFHSVYIEKCPNKVLIKTIDQLRNSPMPVTYSSRENNDDILFELFASNNRQHKEILAAFIKHDLDLLEKLIVGHWNEYNEHYL